MQWPETLYNRGLRNQETRNMTVAAAETLEMPLMSSFMAAGSRRKLSVAVHSTSETVWKKKPNWMADAPQVRSLIVLRWVISI